MNPRKKRTSWREIRQQRQSVEFVGRTEQLTMFRENLAKPVDDEQRRFIFNIWGQGGVGKTTLTKKFIKLAEEAGWATAYTDESENDVPGVLARLAKQFKEQGHELKKFDERYKVYRQKRQELESDPEAPQGFTSFAVGTLAKVGLKMGRRVPVGGALLEMVDEEAVATHAGQMAEFIRRKFTNKDEVQLLEDPETALTPLFVEGLNELAETHPFVLFLDTYEQTGQYLDEWLQKLLDEEFGEIPPEFILVVAGRERLNRNTWALFEQENLITYFSIEPFTEQEARDYLARTGIENEEVIKIILQLSGRLPLLVAMLAEGSPNEPKEVGEPSGTAVERFLKWVDDPKQRQFAIDAALLRELNRDMAKVLDTEHGEALLDWLIKMPFISERANGWVYHEVVRQQMLRYKRRESLQAWTETHRKLAAYYDALRQGLGLSEQQIYLDVALQAYTLNWLYHQLCQNPHEHLAFAIQGFAQALTFKGGGVWARRWADTTQIAGREAATPSLLEWGQKMKQGLDDFDGRRYEDALTFLDQLLDQPYISTFHQGMLLNLRGHIFHQLGKYEQALRDMNSVLALHPEDITALNQKGWTYTLMGLYDEALAQYTRLIELSPQNKLAFLSRGQVFRKLWRYKQALLDFDQALAIDSKFESAYLQRGLTYDVMGQNKQAVIEFTHALEINPQQKWALVNRGRNYRKLKQYSLALADFDKALEIDPLFSFSLVEKGLTYEALQQYEATLLAYNRAVESDSNDKRALTYRASAYRRLWQTMKAFSDVDQVLALDPRFTFALTEKGLTCIQIKQFEPAIELFTQVLQIDPQDKWAAVYRGNVFERLKLYENALADYKLALTLDDQFEWALSRRARTYAIMGCYSEALEAINQAINLKGDSEWHYFLRGLLLQKINQMGEAELDFQRCLELVQIEIEKFSIIWNNRVNLAYFYLGMGRPQLAMQTYEQILQDNAPTYVLQQALEDLDDLLELLPDLDVTPARALLQNALDQRPSTTP